MESVPNNDAEVQKRRSTRIAQSVPITVIGVDALGQAFKERTSTVSINCHGCKYQSKHYVPKTGKVTVEIPREADAPPRIVEGRVAWVQRPRTVRELFQIGVEFTIPGNVWGIAFPPADWFPLPGEHEETLEIPAPSQAVSHHEATPDATHNSETAHETPSESSALSAADAASAERKIHVVQPSQAVSGLSSEEPTREKAAESAKESMSMARQMAHLVAEAKQHLRRSMQSGAAEAVAQEVGTAREELESQLRATVDEAVRVSATKAAEESVHEAVQNAVQASLQQLVERATRQTVENTMAALEQARSTAAPSAQELDAQVRASVERVIAESAAKLAEKTIEDSVHQTVEQAVGQAVEQAVKQSVERATNEASATLRTSAQPNPAPTGEALRQLEDAAQSRLAEWRKEIEDTATHIQSKTLERLSGDSEAVGRKWHEQFEAALSGASEKIGEQLSQISRAATARAEEEISARGASLKTLLNDAAAEAQKNLDSLCSGLEDRRARAEAASEKVAEVTRQAEETTAQIEAMSRASRDEARLHFDSLLSAKSEELKRIGEELIQRKSAEIEKPMQDAADNALRRLAEQVERELTPQLDRAEKAAQQLSAAGEQADEALRSFRERMHEASEHALNASLAQMRQQAAEMPAEFEQSCRTALAKMQEELDAKSSDATHSTFEALYKASEWYQKKAQTAMQSALEKTLEQSTGGMRERAAEMSRMFAAELDTYSRNYAEHAQGMLEEGAKEIKERTRAQMEDTARAVTAGLTDELRRITSESLLRFEDAARASETDAEASMKRRADAALGDFDSHLEERMVQGATEARRHLENQLKPLVDTFYTKREAEQKAWLEQMKVVVEQSMEQYKERLENTSNSWLLASATTLGHHSKAVLETLSGAAEERLRETCADVFAGLGETLRARLLGLSSDVGTGKKNPEKK